MTTGVGRAVEGIITCTKATVSQIKALKVRHELKRNVCLFLFKGIQ